MDELGRLLILIGGTGVAFTALGLVSAWWMEESRRVRRGLKRVLGAEPQALLIAPGRGKGAAFDFTRNRLAVVWDGGGWGLVYRFDELAGAELILDGRVAGRVHRGEARRALDALGDAERQVRLRLAFADARWPDFDLDLWLTEDAQRRHAPNAREATEEANRWLARVEAILRQPMAARPAPLVAQQAQRAPAGPKREREPARDDARFDDEDDPYDDPPF